MADGLAGYFYLLAVKGVMDGLAMTSFVKMFRWPAAMSAIPVFALLGFITLICQHYAEQAAARRQQRAFGEHLAHHASARRSQSGAHGWSRAPSRL